MTVKWCREMKSRFTSLISDTQKHLKARGGDVIILHRCFTGDSEGEEIVPPIASPQHVPTLPLFDIRI